MEETCVPVEDEQEVVDERNESQDVGIVRVTLAPIHERPKLKSESNV
jgi:hypothetical protein